MKERPILFSGPMVRAILDDRKTQTRRVVKMEERAVRALANASPPLMEGDRARWNPDDGVNAWNAWCPYGRPGDRLWVRETWAVDDDYDDLTVKEIGAMRAVENPGINIWYAADSDAGVRGEGGGGKWRPSIHCFRWASRITLEVTEVRVERVQDITENDARAEGATPFPYDSEGDCWDAQPCETRYRTAFEYLWGTINGFGQGDAKRPGCAWSDNPWVWAVTFNVIRPEVP